MSQVQMIEHPVAFTTEAVKWEQIPEVDYVRDRPFLDVVNYLNSGKQNVAIFLIEGIHVTVFRGGAGDNPNNFYLIDEFTESPHDAFGGHWSAEQAVRAATNPDGPYDPETESDDDEMDEEQEEEEEADEEDEDEDEEAAEEEEEEEELQRQIDAGEISFE